MEELFRSMAKRGRITLSPVNPDFEPIVLASADEGSLQVLAEVVEVLGGGGVMCGILSLPLMSNDRKIMW